MAALGSVAGDRSCGHHASAGFVCSAVDIWRLGCLLAAGVPKCTRCYRAPASAASVQEANVPAK